MAPSLPPSSHVPAPYDGPGKAEVLALRQRHCNPAIFTYYREPLMIVEGHMQYLYDEEGRRYLDLFAGIVTVSCGHGHPRVVTRAQEQLARLQHTTTIYLHPLLGEFASRLAAKLPPGLEVAYFTNSGSEANDLALTMARLYTGHHDIVALRNGYHGGISSMMGVTALHTWKYPLPQGVGIHHTVCPDPYRSPFPGPPAEIARRSAADLEQVIRHSTPGRIAAFIAEPIQGVGGTTTAPPPYYQLAYEVVRRHGGLCIADEVQTGFGRTGDHYWGFENFGVVPDIVTMAKGIGNGAPLAAVVTRREIAQTLAQRLHFNTFGGNPVSMAQGLAVLAVIEEEGLQENARVVGGHFKQGLEKLQATHPLIGDVRGQGLMLGVELVRDRQTKEPDPAAATALWEYARQQGVLTGKGGLHGNVLRLKPPLCITRQDVDYALEVFGAGLAQIAATGSGS